MRESYREGWPLQEHQIEGARGPQSERGGPSEDRWSHQAPSEPALCHVGKSTQGAQLLLLGPRGDANPDLGCLAFTVPKSHHRRVKVHPRRKLSQT